MIITNKHNLPDFVFSYLSNDEYDYIPNTISATRLMQSPRMHHLKKRHEDKLEIDVSELIASRYGTAIHDSIEKVELPNCIQEQRLSSRMKGYIITGKFDIMRKVDNHYELIDIKSTSVWSWVYGGKEEDYIRQLSIYRWLAFKNGYSVVEDAKIWMFFTDWNSSKTSDNNYPPLRTAIKPIKLWTVRETESWIIKRLNLFSKTEKLSDQNLPLCSDEELWRTSTLYKVFKDKRKSSIRNCKTIEEAELVNLNNKGSWIQEVKGEVKRCKYCVCRPVCNQYQEIIKEEENGSN